MKYSYFTTAAIALLSGAIEANAIVLDFDAPAYQLYGLHVSDNPGAQGVNGMQWGIVINLTGSTDFSQLDNTLDSKWFSGGIDKSGQLIGNDLVYLTADTSLRTEQIGLPFLNMHGGISGTAVLEESGENFSLEASKAYNFVIVWFETSIASGEAPDVDRRYGYLQLADFTIPAADQANGRTYAFVTPEDMANGNMASLVRVGTFVPEPSTYALLLSGLVMGACVVARRRRGKATA